MPKSPSNSQAVIDVNFRLAPRLLKVSRLSVAPVPEPGFWLQQLIRTLAHGRDFAVRHLEVPPTMPLVIFPATLSGSSRRKVCIFGTIECRPYSFSFLKFQSDTLREGSFIRSRSVTTRWVTIDGKSFKDALPPHEDVDSLGPNPLAIPFESAR